MGLLDEAIREHLELKRQRGADPTEVAREEHDALDPVERPPRHGQAAAPAAPAAPVAQPAAEPAAEPADSGKVEQFWNQPAAPAAPALPPAAPLPPPHPGEQTVEWKLDPEPEPEPEPAPGPAADVLQDTPEFLQETPEHDRLWFEQKPPRDFNFDG